MKLLICILISLAPSICFAANQGKILVMSFVGKNESIHPDIVQFTIEGGYSKNDCDPNIAAIRSSDRHLVSAAIAAEMANKEIRVSLNSGDRYFGNRCVITSITFPN